MPIPPDTVRHLMTLARLKLPDEELSRLGRDLDAILGHVEALKGVDVGDTPPMTHAVATALPVREDASRPGTGPAGLAGSAGKEGRFVRVPKIVE